MRPVLEAELSKEDILGSRADADGGPPADEHAGAQKSAEAADGAAGPTGGRVCSLHPRCLNFIPCAEASSA